MITRGRHCVNRSHQTLLDSSIICTHCARWDEPAPGKEVLLLSDTEQQQRRSPRDGGRFLHRLHHVLSPCRRCSKTLCWEGVKDKQLLCGKRLQQHMCNRLCQSMHQWNCESRRWFNHLNTFGFIQLCVCDSGAAKPELVHYHAGSNDRWWQLSQSPPSVSNGAQLLLTKDR